MIEIKSGQIYRCPARINIDPIDIFFIIDYVDEQKNVFYRYAPESEWYAQKFNVNFNHSHSQEVFITWIEKRSLFLVDSTITIET